MTRGFYRGANRTFTFAQAQEIVPYLRSLGVSDCYASPYFQAHAESLHGYDITDHNKLNAAIGT
ncbi:MAG: alpha-amylase family glycosyl hydrolase [Chthoniobacterales bacterium]